MNNSEKRRKNREKRAVAIRKKIVGTAETPRLAVKRSLKHFSAQIIDDASGATLVSASTHQKSFGNESGNKTDIAKALGEFLAEKANEKGITKVKFDRKGFPYHGRVKAFADGVREKGIQF